MSTFDLIKPAAIEDDGAFSRASTATYYDRTGVLRTAAMNVPRLNYIRTVADVWPEPATGGWQAGLSLLLPAGPPVGEVDEADPFPIAFLVEGATTNLLLQSQDLTTGWTATNVTISANAGVAPDGTTTADLIVPDDTESADHKVFRLASATVTAGAKVGASAFLASGGYATALLRCAPSGEAAGFEVRIDLAAGEILSAGPFGTGATMDAARLITLPGGYYRVEIEGAVAGVTTYGLAVGVGGGEAFVGDEESGVLAWGCDLEVGGVTSYVPSTTTAGTRAADVGTPMYVPAAQETDPFWDEDDAPYALGATVRGLGADIHTVFASLVADNSAALTDTTKWLKVGATNPWRLFDKVVSGKSTSPLALDFIAIPGQFVDTLVLMGLSAGEVRVAQIDPDDGVVKDDTYSLVDDSEIVDWYAYFFNDIRRKTKLVVSDLLPYTAAKLAVMLSDVDATVEAGEAVIGQASQLGITQAGASVGMTDYSRKVRNEFGEYSFVERAFTRRMRCNILVDKPKVDYANDLFATYRAKPIVYIASDYYDCTVIYGVAKDAEAVIAYPDHSIFTFDGESLI